ncbi:hypothetical protein ACQP1O_25615 [Nocardia sp. CA-151230]|uniref:hypothetical protein n=1 Tax=Nocardia sp. CA-151230 TaxID=3239982 RepID=UPI003D92750A
MSTGRRRYNPGTAMTPIAALGRGLVASAAGTLAMDLALYARYRAGGGERRFREWEFSSGVTTWDGAPAPAQVGKRLVEGLFLRKLPDRDAALMNNVTRWGYGLLAGIQYGIVAGSLARPRARYGLLFGSALWAAGYVVLPAAQLYQPIWKYDARTLAHDLGAHLVFGLVTAAVFSRLSGR